MIAVLLLLGSPFLRVAVRPARRPRAAASRRRRAGRQRPAARATSPATPPRRSRSSSSGVDGRRRRRAVDALRRGVSALDGVARVDGPHRDVRRRRARRRARRGAARSRRRRHRLERRAVDRDRLAGGRGARPRRSATSTPTLDVLVGGAVRRSSSTPRRRSSARLPLALGARSSCRHVRPAVPAVGQRARADQGARAQRAQPHRDVRGDGVDLPGRPPVGAARLHRHRARSTRRCRS